MTFSIPYLLNAPYANLGSRVGFIFGTVATISIIFAYLFVSDCKGRSLEEINWLFENKVSTRKFVREKVEDQEGATLKIQEKPEVRETTREML